MKRVAYRRSATGVTSNHPLAGRGDETPLVKRAGDYLDSNHPLAGRGDETRIGMGEVRDDELLTIPSLGEGMKRNDPLFRST